MSGPLLLTMSRPRWEGEVEYIMTNTDYNPMGHVVNNLLDSFSITNDRPKRGRPSTPEPMAKFSRFTRSSVRADGTLASRADARSLVSFSRELATKTLFTLLRIQRAFRKFIFRPEGRWSPYWNRYMNPGIWRPKGDGTWIELIW